MSGRPNNRTAGSCLNPAQSSMQGNPARFQGYRVPDVGSYLLGTHVVDIVPGKPPRARKPVGDRQRSQTPKFLFLAPVLHGSSWQKSSSVQRPLNSTDQEAGMARVNAGLHSNVPADDGDAGPLHGKHSSSPPGFQYCYSMGLTLNQVPLLQSWTSLSSTASLRPNRSFPPLLCSPSPLPRGT